MTHDELQAIKARAEARVQTAADLTEAQREIPYGRHRTILATTATETIALVAEVERLRNVCSMQATWLQANIDAGAPLDLLRDVVIRSANVLRDPMK